MESQSYMNANIKNFLTERNDGVSLFARDRISELEAAICEMVNQYNPSTPITTEKIIELKNLVYNRTEIKE